MLACVGVVSTRYTSVSVVHSTLLFSTFSCDVCYIYSKADVTKTGNGEWGMGNGEWAIRNEK